MLLVVALPAGADEAGSSASARWLARGAALEAEGALLDSALAFERAARAAPGQAEPCWRAARSHWRHGERLQLAGEPGATPAFERAERWASEGLARDSGCAGCALWRYASMGRLVPVRGYVWAARHAREMASLLDRGLAAGPSYRDPGGNSLLANLHYASAVFYRMVPESFWVGLFVGVRGDLDRSLSHIRKALALSARRVDYQVEHGAILLCLATRREDARSATEGRTVLERALALPPRFDTDPLDQDYARRILEAPEKACHFSRLGFIDVEAEGRRVTATAGPDSAVPRERWRLDRSLGAFRHHAR
jgi:hypothetical protein